VRCANAYGNTQLLLGAISGSQIKRVQKWEEEYSRSGIVSADERSKRNYNLSSKQRQFQ